MEKKLRVVILHIFFFLIGTVFISILNPSGLVGQSTGDIADPPTIKFNAEKQTVSETDGTIQITVNLAESNGTGVSADIVFLENSSTVSSSDIDGFLIQEVLFSDSDATGTSKTISISLDDDSEYEGTEIAVFALQNVSGGSAIFPTTLSLFIEDNDSPDIVINEIMADPGSEDINNDGNVSDGDEFIEIINKETEEINITNWTLSDEKGITYTFPSGSVLPANSALIIFGGGNPAGNFGSAVVQTASSLGLNNDGDTITLKDANGVVMASAIYGPTTQGISFNRDADGTETNFEAHTTVGTGNYSPGTKADGASFGSALAISITGHEGWRIISSPTKNTTFDDLLGGLWMQGNVGSNAPSENPTLYEWNEAGGGIFSTPPGMKDEMVPGKGYFVFVFRDDDNNLTGIQGGFPKVLTAQGEENDNSVPITVTSTDEDGNFEANDNEGWNLLGNPFGTDILVSEVINLFNNADPNYQVQGDLQVWDQSSGGGNGSYETLLSSETIAPFQAFWVKFDSTGLDKTVEFDRNILEANEGSEFYKETEINNLVFELGDGKFYDNFSLEFRPDAALGRDRFDTYKLYSLNPESINLFSLFGGDKKLVKNALPIDLQNSVEIPFSFDTFRPGPFTLTWSDLKNLPKSWNLKLMDNVSEREIDLRTNDSYQFETFRQEKIKVQTQEITLNRSQTQKEKPRFKLVINSGKTQNKEEIELPESVKLNPNYPNPFNPSTTISFELTEQSEVMLNVYTIVGQKVATLVDGVREAGIHREIWNAADMPSGIYIAQLEVGGKVYIRKMTLIK